MKLITFLEERRMSYTDFGKLIGASPSGVRRYALGERYPKTEIMRRIVEATDGAVGPQDFLEQNAETETA